MSATPRNRRVPSILLIGFEPFGGDEVNPSQEILRQLDGRRIDRVRYTPTAPETTEGGDA